MNGSLACSPMCGGVFMPVAPTSAIGLPLNVVNIEQPSRIGAENGSPGVGTRNPERADQLVDRADRR